MHLAMRGVYLFPKKSDTRFLKADGWSIVSLPGVDGYSLIELFTNDSGLSFDNSFSFSEIFSLQASTNLFAPLIIHGVVVHT